MRRGASADRALPVSLRKNLSREVKLFSEEADSNLAFGQKIVKLHHDQHLYVTVIFKESDEIYLHRLSLLCSAMEKSATDGYKKLFQRNEGP